MGLQRPITPWKVICFKVHQFNNRITAFNWEYFDGTEWKDMVPNAVYEYIIENGLTEKVIRLLQK